MARGGRTPRSAGNLLNPDGGAPLPGFSHSISEKYAEISIETRPRSAGDSPAGRESRRRRGRRSPADTTLGLHCRGKPSAEWEGSAADPQPRDPAFYAAALYCGVMALSSCGNHAKHPKIETRFFAIQWREAIRILRQPISDASAEAWIAN